MRTRRFRLFALFALCLQLGACLTWSPVTTPPDQLLAGPDAPERIRVTRNDGSQITLEQPEVRAGALVATAAPGAVLLDDTRAVEVEKVSVGRTIALVLPGVIVVAAVAKIACRC